FGNKGPSAVALVPAVGGALVPVTDNTALNVSPAWTPDGRHILFVSNREGARDVYAVRLGSSGVPTGKPSRLTTGLNAHSISLSADGTRLAYSVYSSRANVWTVPIPIGWRRRSGASDGRSGGGAGCDLVARRAVLVVLPQRNRRARRAVRHLQGSNRPLGAVPTGLESPDQG